MDDAGEPSDRAGRMRAHTRALLGEDSGPPADLAASLDHLCVAAAEELKVSAVVLTLMSADGSRAVAGASEQSDRELDEIQFSLGEGPGCDAFAAARPVLIPDLESAFTRWPGYVSAALRAGIRAAYTFPLQVGAMQFGILSFYADQARSFDAAELTQCLVFAEIATEMLLENSSRGSLAEANRGLRDSLRFHSEIYQAQGMVMVALDISLVEALARMRAHAFALDLDLNDLAVGIIKGTIELPADGA